MADYCFTCTNFTMYVQNIIMKFGVILFCLFTMIEKVISKYLYSMADCCQDPLRRFTLMAVSWPDQYTYTDPGGSAQDVYTVVPAPRINFAVKSIQISARAENHSTGVLTLCEVFVFGGEYKYKVIKWFRIKFKLIRIQ